MARIWLGEVSLAAARRAGDIDFDGPAALARAFPSWLQLSVFASPENEPRFA